MLTEDEVAHVHIVKAYRDCGNRAVCILFLGQYYAAATLPLGRILW
jgi:hypothetical protein